MKVLVIDGDNMCYRAYFAYTRMQSKGQSVSAIYGFPSILASLVKKQKPDELVICWDGFKSKHRMKLCPAYKQGKARLSIDKEDLIAQKIVLQNMFTHLGVIQYYHPDVEGDDMIYMAARHYRKKGAEVYLVSSDKDFRQLLSPNLCILDERANKLINEANHFSIFKHNANQSLDYLIMLGDKSDNIKGYAGIGERKANTFLHHMGSIHNYLTTKGNDVSHVNKRKLEEVYLINREMIGLKYFFKKHKKELMPNYRKISGSKTTNVERFKDLCKKYNLKTFLYETFYTTFTP